MILKFHRCKGGSLCSTGCFAKYGSDQLNNLISCSVEKNDCVHVPRTESVGWHQDKVSDLPSIPISSFRMASLRGTWYKVMGLDSRYDCFDCQKNSFIVLNENNIVDKTRKRGRTQQPNSEIEARKSNKRVLEMNALFRIPRPSYPGYLQNDIHEILRLVDEQRDPADEEDSVGSENDGFSLTRSTSNNEIASALPTDNQERNNYGNPNGVNAFQSSIEKLRGYLRSLHR